MMWVVIRNPFEQEGPACWGPFATEDEAQAWADCIITRTAPLLMPLRAPSLAEMQNTGRLVLRGSDS